MELLANSTGKRICSFFIKLLPVLLFLILSFMVVFLWRLLENQEDANRHESVETEALQVFNIINLDLRNRINSLHRIVNRWEIRGGTPEIEFKSDLKAYLIDDPGYQALEWVDNKFFVRWIIPVEGNEAALGMNLAFEGKRKKALEKARNRQEPTLSSPINLVQGGKGFLVYFPIFVEQRFDGFLLAVFRTHDWFDYLLNRELDSTKVKKFIYCIYINDEEVFKSDLWDKKKDLQWNTKLDNEIYGHNLSIRISPTNTFIRNSHSFLPELILAVGLIFSFLLGLIFFLIQKAKEAVKTTLVGKIKLENEITIRKDIELLLAREKQRLSNILEGTNVGTWEWNIQSGESYINERWANIIGFSLEEISPFTVEAWKKFCHPEDLKVSEKLLSLTFNKKLDYYECEIRMLHKNNNWIWVLDRGKVSTWTENGKPLLMSGTHLDITKRKESEEKIKYLATHDLLTGLPSLSLVKDRINMSLEAAKRKKIMAAVLFIDLDGFKHVNDTFGHDAGDFVLKEVAKRLLLSVRKVDTVARIGGDEFLIVLTELNTMDNAEKIAAEIVSSISSPILFNNEILVVGTSIGISIYPKNGDSEEILIKHADEAMYSVKKSGKNGYNFAK